MSISSISSTTFGCFTLLKMATSFWTMCSCGSNARVYWSECSRSTRTSFIKHDRHLLMLIKGSTSSKQIQITFLEEKVPNAGNTSVYNCVLFTFPRHLPLLMIFRAYARPVEYSTHSRTTAKFPSPIMRPTLYRSEIEAGTTG